MPGILPMKVIKVGNSSQSRIAQACDRCRSKKIRCDGIRPCCSQCSNVGFECKTSDKLSRRAFPRGYTESLEERVRALESEVRELKDLLDEKDEKIDMLSKMHANRRGSQSSVTTAPSSVSREMSLPLPKDDVFKIQESPQLLGSDSSDPYFMGSSSGRAFVESLKRKIQESGKSCTGFKTEAFLNVPDVKDIESTEPEATSTIPPRLFSDRCVNIFFQEWAPLFPIIHRPTFLRLYEEYVTKPEAVEDRHKLAQLHLVFAIAGLSSEMPDRQRISSCEQQWKKAVDAIIMDSSMNTLQILLLATLYCISKGDYKRLQHYKGIAVGLSHRLGLHQSQKRFSLGALSVETRKKVFWSLYTIDCFSAAMLGLPKLMKEEDIHCEYPTDIDDEYVTEKGFLPTLPGEATKVSNSLALFRASRILSKVLDQIYPAAASHELSLQHLSALEAEINEWSDTLPQHLKLTFIQDKPSTNMTGSRSALLSLAYYYIKSLVHRPAVGCSLGEKASSSVITLANSSKHMIQIIQLLEERNMSFSFCVNRNEMLTLCGMSLLFQSVDLPTGSSIAKDSHRLVNVVCGYLAKWKSPGAEDFQRLASSMIPVVEGSKPTRRASDNDMPAPRGTVPIPVPSMSRNELVQKAHRKSMDLELLRARQDRIRRATLPTLHSNGLGNLSNHSQSSIESASSSPATTRPTHRSPSSGTVSLPTPTLNKRSSHNTAKPKQNLDYLSLSNTPACSQPQSPFLSRTSKVHTPNFPNGVHIIPTPAQSQKLSSVSAAEWESLLSSLDNGHSNIYDAMYGGPAISLTNPIPTSVSSATSNVDTAPSMTSSGVYGEWSPEAWDMNTLNMTDFDITPGQMGNSGQAQSVLSFSDESLSSGEGRSASVDSALCGSSAGSLGRTVSMEQFRLNSGLVAGGHSESFLLDTLDSAFVL